MTAQTTRRAILAGAATLPALSLPATADLARVPGDSREAMIVRGKQIVDVLSDRYICEGWHESFDHKRAAAFLDSIQRFDWNDGNCEHFKAMNKWISDHGQSLDYLGNGDMAVLFCYGASHSRNAAALPGGADPAFASEIGPNHPDAELLAIGRQFDALLPIYEDAELRSIPYEEAHLRALREMPEGVTNDEFCERINLACKDYEVAAPTCDDVSNAMAAPMKCIMNLPAQTMAGLAVKAKSARFACSHFWDQTDDADADWDELVARKLIDEIIAMGATA